MREHPMSVWIRRVGILALVLMRSSIALAATPDLY